MIEYIIIKTIGGYQAVFPLVNKLEWVMDFTDIKDVVKPVIKQLDHYYMNDIAGLHNPTCENSSIWIWDKLKKVLPQLKRIELFETPTSGVTYDGQH